MADIKIVASSASINTNMAQSIEEKTSAVENAAEGPLVAGALYRQPWSQTVSDIVQNWCRTNVDLPKNKVIPSVLFSLIGYFWSGDQTRNHAYIEYMYSIVAVKYIRHLQIAKKPLPKFKSIKSDLEQYLPKKKSKYKSRLSGITPYYVLKCARAILNDDIVDVPKTLKWEVNKHMLIVIDRENRCIVEELSRPGDVSQHYRIWDHTKQDRSDITTGLFKKTYNFEFRLLDAMAMEVDSGDKSAMEAVRAQGYFWCLNQYHTAVEGPSSVDKHFFYGLGYDGTSRVYIFCTAHFWVIIHWIDEDTGIAVENNPASMALKLTASTDMALLKKPFDQLCHSMC